jgi:hypothetical protein
MGIAFSQRQILPIKICWSEFFLLRLNSDSLKIQTGLNSISQIQSCISGNQRKDQLNDSRRYLAVKLSFTSIKASGVPSKVT